MVTATLWDPWPSEVAFRRRHTTRATTERYGPTGDCCGCFRKSQHHSERCRARFQLLCVGEGGPVEVRAQEGQPAPPDPAAPNFASALTAVQAGSVNPEVMEAEDDELATGSQVPAEAAPISPFVTGDDEGTVAGLRVCSLLPPVDERPVCDHKTV